MSVPPESIGLRAGYLSDWSYNYCIPAVINWCAVRQELEGDASGQVRRSGKLVLNPQKQELRRGRAFPFSFECTDLGELQKVKIGHDNAGYSVRACCSVDFLWFMVGGLVLEPLRHFFDTRMCTL